MNNNIKKISVKKSKNNKNKEKDKITIDSVNWILANKKEFPNSLYSPDNGVNNPILRILLSSLAKRLELKKINK